MIANKLAVSPNLLGPKSNFPIKMIVPNKTNAGLVPNFNTLVGLTFLGIGIGNFIGLAILGYSSDRVLKHLTLKNGGKAKPEYRLPPLIYGYELNNGMINLLKEEY